MDSFTIKFRKPLLKNTLGLASQTVSAALSAAIIVLELCMHTYTVDKPGGGVKWWGGLENLESQNNLLKLKVLVVK